MASTDLKTIRVDFRPGVDKTSTRYKAEGTWYDADKVRFRSGVPENIRGWEKQTVSPLIGKARDILTWADNAGNSLIALGTECKLYVVKGGALYDITPIDHTVSIVDGINTTSNSVRVVVSAVHGITGAHNYVVFTSQGTTVGGNIYLNGDYFVSVINANSFAVDTSVSAVATSAGAGGQLTIGVEIACGTSLATYGFGYGTGPYGMSTYGTPRTTSNVVLDMRQWSLDTWGQDLMACIRGGRLYHWDSSIGVSARATIVNNAPTQNNFIKVSPEDRHLISFGGTDVITSVFDPHVVQWCDTEDYNTWIPTVTNAAGSFRIDGGNELIAACRGARQINFFSDDTAHAMTYVGPPYTFGFSQLGGVCGIIAPHACTEFNSKIYWMSTHNFHVYDGQVKTIPCTLLKYVFDDINLVQKDKIYVGTNKEFGEIIWLYCSSSSNDIDRYVIYNTTDGSWVNGTFNWTVWADQTIFDNVIVVGSDSYIRNMDVDDLYTGDGLRYESMIETADFDIADGGDMVFWDRIIPDFDIDGTIQLFVTSKKYPGGSEITKGPYSITDSTAKIDFRQRGRQVRMRLSTSATPAGVRWQLGALRFNLGPDGSR